MNVALHVEWENGMAELAPLRNGTIRVSITRRDTCVSHRDHLRVMIIF